VLLLAVQTVPCPWASASDNGLLSELRSVPYKIVYETYRNDNWELFMISADGSDRVNLTRTPDVHELYPHVSPDGTKVSFVVDEGEGESKSRNVYYMKLDGSGRKLVARNARQPFWSPDGRAIAYLKGEFEKFTYWSPATKEIMIYDVTTGRHREHPNRKIEHLFSPCWSTCGKWFLATVHGGMGYRHTNLVIEVEGTKVFDLGIGGCRPDVGPDGTKVAWTPTDWALRVGDLDLSGPKPKVTGRRDVVISKKPIKVYHVDWSPDGRYIAFCRGPAKKRLGLAPEGVGARPKDWNLCVADVTQKNCWVPITTDGMSNKEPDWVNRY